MPVRESEDLQAACFLSCAGLLLAVGTLAVYSSSITARPSDAEQIMLSRQLMFLLGTGLVGIAISQFPKRYWGAAAPWLFAGTFALLVLVLMPGIGHKVNGARRWLRLGLVSLQPSETAKLTLPLLLTAWIAKAGTTQTKRRRLLPALSLALATILLVGVEPDLGTALFLAVSTGLVLFLSGTRIRYFLLGGGLAVPALLSVLVLKPYQMARIQGFIDTWVRPEEAPYQVKQSLTTLGVGGLTGVGLGKGWQKLSFLPEANTDFIFAVIGEELGLCGTLGIVLLWSGLYWSGTRLIRRLPPRSFEAILATTLLAQLVLQAGVNMAVVTALLPPKGISHPFISYGGSNLLASVLSLGLIVSLTRCSEDVPELQANIDLTRGN